MPEEFDDEEADGGATTGLSLVPLTADGRHRCPTDEGGGSPPACATGGSRGTDTDKFHDHGTERDEEDGPLLQDYEGGRLHADSSVAAGGDDGEDDVPPATSRIRAVSSVVGVVLVLFWMKWHAGGK